MKKTFFFLLACLLPPGAADAAESRHVVELFTSQGCSSCPPAERLLGDLIKSREDIVALELHVDYWDDLVYGLAGKWSDPFSDSAHTQRQRRYKARGLAGNNGVYTPQAVVNGQTAVVGSNERALNDLLQRPAPSEVHVEVRREGGTMRVSVSGQSQSGARAEVWFYIYDEHQVTKVEAGENAGKTLSNHHVVREMRHLGPWRGHSREYTVDNYHLIDNRGCAVVVQQPGQGPVLGAGLCPT